METSDKYTFSLHSQTNIKPNQIKADQLIEWLISWGVYFSQTLFVFWSWSFNPLTAKLFNLSFHPLEVVSHWRDPQFQVSENYTDLTIWRSTIFKYCWLMSLFIFNMFERWLLKVLIKNENPNIFGTGGSRVKWTKHNTKPFTRIRFEFDHYVFVTAQWAYSTNAGKLQHK